MHGVVAASVLWVGERSWRDRPRYNALWVERLRAMVARNLSIPHHFICLSNVELPGIDRIPLQHDWPGWWSKIELFGPSIQAERIIYLDLDVLITGSLDDLVLHPAPMVLLPPHHKILGIRPTAKKGVIRRYQSSCIVWSPPVGREIYSLFNPEPVMKRFRGDQDWIGFIEPDRPKFDLSVVCKLSQCGSGGPPKGVRLVLAVGGKNEEAAKRYEWARGIWKV